MNVGEELKRKQSELRRELAEIEIRARTLRTQVDAIDQVIRIYDPNYTPTSESVPSARRPRKTASVPQHFSEISKTKTILNALREANRPLTATEYVELIGAPHGLTRDDPSFSVICSRANATLDSWRSAVVSAREVRMAGGVSGRSPPRPPR